MRILNALPLPAMSRKRSMRDAGIRKSILDPSARSDLYAELELFLKTSAQLDLALEEMYKIYSDDGKTPRSKLALVLREVLAHLAQGNGFAVGISRFIPEAEYFLLSAGEASGNLSAAFRQCIRQIKVQRRIRSALIGGYAYNSFLAMFLVGYLLLASLFVIPQAMLTLDPHVLTGLAYGIYATSEVVVHGGPWIGVAVVIALIAFHRSKPRYTGRMRTVLDRHWPYATYRTLQGVTFLISLSSLIAANVGMGDALKELARNGSPYIKQRIDAVLRALAAGAQGLGAALNSSGYEFPDRRSIVHLRILGSRAGAEAAIAEFADDVLSQSLDRIESNAKIGMVVGVVVIAALTVVIFVGMLDIQNQARVALGMQ